MRQNREISEEFMIVLEHYLDKNGMSLTKLAEATGVSVGYLSRLKRGERKAPSVPITLNIAKTLKMPPSYILKMLDIEEEPGVDSTPDLYELIMFEDFHIEGEQIEMEVKEIIVSILQSIITSKWRNETIASESMILASRIEELKSHFRM